MRQISSAAYRERDQPVDFKEVATRLPQDTAVSESSLWSETPHFSPSSLSLWLCQQLLLLLALSHSPYNDISEIKMDYGASLTQSLQDVKPHVMLLLL